MTKNSSTPPSKFEHTLYWLNPDPDQAGKKYETIRWRLIEILASRGCHEADHWADVTIDRVVSKIDEIEETFQGDPAHYFYGVAKKVFLEYLKKKPHTPPPNPPIPPSPPLPSPDLELEHACLEHCLDQLTREDRKLICSYYTKERREKINHRNELAAEMGIGLNALRIKTHRIRITVRKCVQDCLKRNNVETIRGEDH